MILLFGSSLPLRFLFGGDGSVRDFSCLIKDSFSSLIYSPYRRLLNLELIGRTFFKNKYDFLAENLGFS